MITENIVQLVYFSFFNICVKWFWVLYFSYMYLNLILKLLLNSNLVFWYIFPIFPQNASSTSLSTTGPEMTYDITNLSTIWTMLIEGDGFNFSDIIPFVKENIGTFMSVMWIYTVLDSVVMCACLGSYL